MIRNTIDQQVSDLRLGALLSFTTTGQDSSLQNSINTRKEQIFSMYSGSLNPHVAVGGPQVVRQLRRPIDRCQVSTKP